MPPHEADRKFFIYSNFKMMAERDLIGSHANENRKEFAMGEILLSGMRGFCEFQETERSAEARNKLRNRYFDFGSQLYFLYSPSLSSYGVLCVAELGKLTSDFL